MVHTLKQEIDQTRTFTVYSFNGYSNEPPSNLEAFAEWAKELLESVPEPHRATATITIDTEYESSSVTIEASYERPLTPEEIESERREKEEYMRKRESERERHERAELKRLQAKYKA